VKPKRAIHGVGAEIAQADQRFAAGVFDLDAGGSPLHG
jgi:hypothetical protein